MQKEYRQLLQHIATEEREFAEKIIELCQQVEDTYSYRLTPFLNPKQEEIVQSLTSYFQLSYYSSRDFAVTEFTRGIIAPAYYECRVEDFEMAALEIVYPRKFYTLSHSQVLGTLLNQLGIKRQLLGDILVGDEELIVFLDKKFADLAQSELGRIGRVPVKWKFRNWSSLKHQTIQDGERKEILLPSLRLDKVVATAFRLSRTNSAKLIEGRQVKLDYVETVQAGRTIALGQLVSVRGFGRIRLLELLGQTKQGKLKVEIEVIKNRRPHGTYIP